VDCNLVYFSPILLLSESVQQSVSESDLLLRSGNFVLKSYILKPTEDNNNTRECQHVIYSGPTLYRSKGLQNYFVKAKLQLVY
jgi:hypothetical protein